VSSAQAAFERHMAAKVSTAEALACEPRMGQAVRELLSDHERLAERLRALAVTVIGAEVVDLWLMIDLGERAVLLEMEFARHYNRLVRLVQEAALVEIGGEA
jgi:hypothetical protein